MQWIAHAQWMFHTGFRLCAVGWVVAGLSCSTTASESGATDAGPSGSSPEGSSPGNEGSTRTDAPAAALEPLSVWEPNLPTEGEFCSMLVAIECDGSEDCPSGQTCCGTLNGGSLAYESVRCEASCDLADGGRVLCHPGDACPNPEEECIRSIILPSYLGICGTRSAFTPEGFEGASRAPGVINCAAGAACTGGDVCCALSSWQAETQQAAFIDGRCAKTAEECSCSGGSEPEPVLADGGRTADAGAKQDGGESDGGAARPDGGTMEREGGGDAQVVD